jgi:hypoxanthine phosphoribosyltransferase
MSFVKPVDYVHPHRIQPLYNAPTIAERMSGMATEITAQLGDEFLIVGILKGSFVFIADLVRALHYAGCAPQVDFMTVSSYGAAKESSGEVTITRDMADNVQGKKLLLADDILESGRTLHHIKHYLLQRGAATVHTCVLLDKPSKRVQAIEADTVGFVIPDVFVVGYGLDYAGYYRELPFIGKL